MSKPRKVIADLIGELRSWLPNYDHGPNDYPTILYRVLASAPGGEELEDIGYEPIGNLGWHELDQLGRVLEAIQDKQDVEDLVAGLIRDEEEEEPEPAAPRGRVGRGETVIRGPYKAMKLPDGAWRLSKHGTFFGVYGSEDEAMAAATDHEKSTTGHREQAPPYQHTDRGRRRPNADDKWPSQARRRATGTTSRGRTATRPARKR